MKRDYYAELFCCCLLQSIIPKEVIENWKKPMYQIGNGMNLAYELGCFFIFITKIIKEEKIK